MAEEISQKELKDLELFLKKGIPQKRVYTCPCGTTYRAVWSKGLCRACRNKKYHKAYKERNYKSLAAYPHLTDPRTNHQDGDWIPVSAGPCNSFTPHHPTLYRENIENKNNIVRKHFQDNRWLNSVFGTNI